MQYVTVADVDAALDQDWASDYAKGRSVAKANVWLDAQCLDIPRHSIPDALVAAGVELANMAAKDQLYVQQSQGAITSKRAKAGSVEAEYTYAEVDSATAGNSALSPDMQYVMDLLKPYRRNTFAFKVGRGC